MKVTNTLYHGSNSSFNNFSLTPFGTHDEGMWGKGIYLTDSKEVASAYGKYIYTCKVTLENPYIVRGSEDEIREFLTLGDTSEEITDNLISQGYDGVISKKEIWRLPNKFNKPIEADQWVIFDPSKIKIVDRKEENMLLQLEEDFETHSKLNKDLFDNESRQLKPIIRDRLTEIADLFVEKLVEDEIPIKVYDYWLVGSNAAYNYTPESDIDLHIIVDIDSTGIKSDIMTILYNYAKSSFNDDYNIKIKGHEVEVYLEDLNTTVNSNGIYSIKKDKWIKEPQPLEDNVIEVEKSDIYKEWEDRYDNLNKDNIDEINSFVDDLYILRKEGLAKGGEFDLANLTFKQFRNDGQLEELKDRIKELESEKLTLENLDRKTAF